MPKSVKDAILRYMHLRVMVTQGDMVAAPWIDYRSLCELAAEGLIQNVGYDLWVRNVPEGWKM